MKLKLIYLPEVDWAEMLKDFDAGGYTQSELAYAMNVHVNTVANYKVGHEPRWRNGHSLVELYRRVFARDPPFVGATRATSS